MIYILVALKVLDFVGKYLVEVFRAVFQAPITYLIGKGEEYGKKTKTTEKTIKKTEKKTKTKR